MKLLAAPAGSHLRRPNSFESDVVGDKRIQVRVPDPLNGCVVKLLVESRQDLLRRQRD
jgi:hypothetical protein